MKREAIDRDVNMSDTTAKRQLLAQLGPLQGLYSVDVRPIRPTRSQQANRYLFGVVYRAFGDFLKAQGQFYDSDQIHEMLKVKFLRETVVNKDTGEAIGVTTRRTSDMTTEEFAEYIDRVVHWLDDMFGIVCPEPDHCGSFVNAGASCAH